MGGAVDRVLLYYPSINVRSNRWLRHAVLYWDKIQTIVPIGYDDSVDRRNRYTDDMHILRGEGFFHPVESSTVLGMQLSEFEHAFFAAVESPAFRTILSSLSSIIRDTPVWQGKADQSLFDRLVDLKLAERESENNPLYNLEYNTAMLLMSMLARYLSDMPSEDIVDPATDDSYFQDAIFTPKEGQDVDVGLSLRLENILPVPQADVELRKILQFKQKRHEELERFRRELDAFYAAAKKSANMKELKRTASGFRAKLAGERKTMQRLLKEAKLPFGFQSAEALQRATIPASLAVLSGAGAISAIPFLAKVGLVGTSAAIMIGKSFIDRRVAINKVNDLPFAYLINAEKAGILN